MPFRDYLRASVLRPIGMGTTDWLAHGDAKSERRASGYVLGSGGALDASAPWVTGEVAGAGGLYSSVREMAKYLAFQLDAWPARSGTSSGPVRRSSRREMQQIQWVDGAGPGRVVGNGLGWGSQSPAASRTFVETSARATSIATFHRRTRTRRTGR